MSHNRFPIEFFQELVKKQMLKDVTEDADVTIVDGEPTEDMHSLEKTAEERIQTQKF